MDLLGSRFDPITEAVGFVEADATLVAATLAGAAGYYGWYQHATRVDPVDGPLDVALASLERMAPFSPSRFLVLPTRSRWTAVFDNSEPYHSYDAIARLATNLRSRAVHFCHVPDMHRKPEGRYGSTKFSVFSPDGAPPEARGGPERLVYAINEGGRWTFLAHGTPQPYELVERYESRRLRDRLTPEMLVAYGRALGIEITDEDFYRPSGYVVTQPGGRLARVLSRLVPLPTLTKVRRRYGLATAASRRPPKRRKPRDPGRSGGPMTPLYEDAILFANNDPGALLRDVTARAAEVQEAGGTIHAIDLDYEDAEGSATMIVTLTEVQARALGYGDEDIERLSQQEIQPDGS